MKGLGRRPQFDERSRNFPIRAMLPSVVVPRSYTWSCPVYLDQLFTSSCVGHAFSHEAAARPTKVPNLTHADAMSVYHRALQLDEWEGEDDSGTSIIAGVKACVERGWYTGYRWAFGIADVIAALGYKGPVVLGINWYEGMGETDDNGFIHVTGEVLGGHGILANAVNIKEKKVRLHNNWSSQWGYGGDCFISFADLHRLLGEQGEACVPLGRKLPLLTRIAGAVLNNLPGA